MFLYRSAKNLLSMVSVHARWLAQENDTNRSNLVEWDWVLIDSYQSCREHHHHRHRHHKHRLENTANTVKPVGKDFMYYEWCTSASFKSWVLIKELSRGFCYVCVKIAQIYDKVLLHNTKLLMEQPRKKIKWFNISQCFQVVIHFHPGYAQPKIIYTVSVH